MMHVHGTECSQKIYDFPLVQCSPATHQETDEHTGPWGQGQLWSPISSPAHFHSLNLCTSFCILFDITERYDM